MTQASLNGQFAALQAERERTWSAEQLAKNTAQREALKSAYNPAKYVQVGDVISPFTLIDSNGAELTRDSLLSAGPAVLIFFRYGGCPACNIALPYYNSQLWPHLQRAGIPLIAVSPQTPVDRDVIERHGLGFTVVSDPGYALERIIGITFEPDEQPEVKAGESWIGSIIGTNSYELPQPAVLILNGDGTIRFIEVSPDWLSRTEAPSILAQLPEVQAIKTA